MPWISLLPLICFINKTEFQEHRLAYIIHVLVWLMAVNIQEQARHQPSTSQISDKHFTDLNLPLADTALS